MLSGRKAHEAPEVSGEGAGDFHSADSGGPGAEEGPEVGPKPRLGGAGCPAL